MAILISVNSRELAAYIYIMKGNSKFFIGLLLGVLLGGSVSFVYLAGKNKSNARFHRIQMDQQAALIEATRDSGQMKLMSNLLDKIDDELQDNPTRILSDETIERIVALSYSFQSHPYVEGDSASIHNRNPGRGYLLLTLSKLKLDSSTLQKILTQTSFAGAALRDADLNNANLSGADLRGADLQGANLQGANLNRANLKGANLWGANMSEAKMDSADLTRADVRWSDLNGADLKKVILHEADLTSAQLRKADLRGAVLQWADFTGAFLNEANLDSADLFRAILKRAQLKNTNLSRARLTYAILSEANLSHANLTEANVTNLIIDEQNWLELLDEWEVTGAGEIQSQFKVVEAFSYEHSKYQLQNITH